MKRKDRLRRKQLAKEKPKERLKKLLRNERIKKVLRTFREDAQLSFHEIYVRVHSKLGRAKEVGSLATQLRRDLEALEEVGMIKRIKRGVYMQIFSEGKITCQERIRALDIGFLENCPFLTDCVPEVIRCSLEKYPFWQASVYGVNSDYFTDKEVKKLYEYIGENILPYFNVLNKIYIKMLQERWKLQLKEVATAHPSLVVKKLLTSKKAARWFNEIYHIIVLQDKSEEDLFEKLRNSANKLSENQSESEEAYRITEKVVLEFVEKYFPLQVALVLRYSW